MACSWLDQVMQLVVRPPASIPVCYLCVYLIYIPYTKQSIYCTCLCLSPLLMLPLITVPLSSELKECVMHGTLSCIARGFVTLWTQERLCLLHDTTKPKQASRELLWPGPFMLLLHVPCCHLTCVFPLLSVPSRSTPAPQRAISGSYRRGRDAILISVFV